MPEFDSTTQYRDVADHPDHKVGSDGSVWSRAGRWPSQRRWRRMKTGRSIHGIYVTVGLTRRGGQTFVHRLVLEAFIGPRPEGMECRHLDGDSLNNRLENLRWGTPQENADDRVRHGRLRRGERQWTAKLDEAAVRDIRASCRPPLPGRTRRRDGMKTAMARKYGVSRAVISEVVSGKLWGHVALS